MPDSSVSRSARPTDDMECFAQHTRNVEALDRMMLELDDILLTLTHDGAQEFGLEALDAIRNLRAVEAVLA